MNILGLSVFAVGIEAVAADDEKFTKLKLKERLKWAPFNLIVLLFFIIGTTSGKPVTAQIILNTETNY